MAPKTDSEHQKLQHQKYRKSLIKHSIRRDGVLFSWSLRLVVNFLGNIIISEGYVVIFAVHLVKVKVINKTLFQTIKKKKENHNMALPFLFINYFFYRLEVSSCLLVVVDSIQLFHPSRMLVSCA